MFEAISGGYRLAEASIDELFGGSAGQHARLALETPEALPLTVHAIATGRKTAG